MNLLSIIKTFFCVYNIFEVSHWYTYYLYYFAYLGIKNEPVSCVFSKSPKSFPERRRLNYWLTPSSMLGKLCWMQIIKCYQRQNIIFRHLLHNTQTGDCVPHAALRSPTATTQLLVTVVTCAYILWLCQNNVCNYVPVPSEQRFYTSV